MRPLARFVHYALGLCLLASLVGTPAFAADDPIISFESHSEMEIDLKMVIDDFLPDLLDVVKAENPMQGQWMDMAVDLAGIRALDRFRMTSDVTKNEGLYRSTVTLDPAYQSGLLPAMAAVPDGTFRFGKYLRGDDAAMLISMANFSEGLKTLYGVVTGPEMAAVIPPGLIKDENGGTTLFGIDFEKDLLPLLDGELDMILFGFEGVTKTDPPPMAVVLGTSDGPALRTRIFELLATHVGDEDTGPLANAAGEQVGSFTFYPLPEGAGYAVSDDYIVLTTVPDRMRAMLAKPNGNLPQKKARQYMRMSTRFLLSMMASKLGNEGGTEEQAVFADLFGDLGEEPPQYMEVTTSAGPNRIDTEIHQPGNLWSMEYRILRNMLTALPRLAAVKSEREQYTGIVSTMDAAFTQYGVDHGGNFPENPEELVEAGYIDAFPDLSPTPLGVYADGAYTYLPLRDESGDVKGYYFFVYGLGAKSGFDIFTPENIDDPASFHPASDGRLDGVASFCYDGLALDQVQEWNTNR